MTAFRGTGPKKKGKKKETAFEVKTTSRKLLILSEISHYESKYLVELLQSFLWIEIPYPNYLSYVRFRT